MPDPRLPLSESNLCDIEACGDCRSWVTPLVAQARAALELEAEVARLRRAIDEACAEIDWWGENATREQITASLKHHNIDTTEAWKVVKAALDARRARDADDARRDAGLGGGT